MKYSRPPRARHNVRHAVITCVAAACSSAWAQTPAPMADPERALEALLGMEIEGASRRVEKSLDAPAAVSVLGRTESDALNHVTVGDMLARLPGTYITTSRSYSAVGLRGFNRPGDYNARLLMAIDGYRVNDAIYDQALPEFEFPIVAAWVKRLELVSGPASSVYGGNALLGVANIVTLDGADAPGLSLRTTAQGAGSWGVTGQYGWHRGETDLFIGVARHALAGETLTLPELAGPALPGGVVAGLDGTQYGSLLMKFRQGPWRATLVSQSRAKDVALAIYGSVPGAPGTRYGDHYAYGELAYDGPWQGDWRSQLRMNLSHSRFDGAYVFEDDAGSRYVNRDIAMATWAGIDARLQWRGWLNHSPILGIEARRTLRGDQINRDDDPGVTYLSRNDKTSQVGLYVQDQIRLSEKTALTLGLRADQVKSYDTQWSPRLAWVHRPDANEALKLMVGRAFRAPNFSERFYDDGGVSQVGNPGLKPEHIGTVELSWERAIGKDARLTLSAFEYRLSDLIDFVPFDAGISRYENVSSARTAGVDVDVEQRLASGWQWRSSLSLARATSGGGTASNSPRWLFKGHVLGPVGERWSAGLQWVAMARREGLRGPVPAFATADAVLRHAITAQQSLSLTVRNLADRASYDPAASDNDLLRVPRERRSWALDWRLAF